MCVIYVQSNLEAMGMEDMKESDLRDVGRFLNRLLGLKILDQNMVSTYIIRDTRMLIGILCRDDTGPIPHVCA